MLKIRCKCIAADYTSKGQLMTLKSAHPLMFSPTVSCNFLIVFVPILVSLLQESTYTHNQAKTEQRWGVRRRDGESKGVFGSAEDRGKERSRLGESKRGILVKWKGSSRLWSSSGVKPPALNQPRFIPLLCQARRPFWLSESILVIYTLMKI